MKFDPSGLNRALDRMQQSAKDKGKDLAVQQGNFFAIMAKKFGWEAAPTFQELDAAYQKLKGRLKRKPGVTPIQELQRRKRARGTYARGWHVINVENLGSRIRIWIGNDVSYAGKVEAQNQTAEKAAAVVQGNFKSKLDRLAKQVTGVFR